MFQHHCCTVGPPLTIGHYITDFFYFSSLSIRRKSLGIFMGGMICTYVGCVDMHIKKRYKIFFKTNWRNTIFFFTVILWNIWLCFIIGCVHMRLYHRKSIKLVLSFVTSCWNIELFCNWYFELWDFLWHVV